jgi:sphingomyelin phosphodiesterase
LGSIKDIHSTQPCNLLHRFESTVTAQFYGHTHNDEFAIFYEEDRATNIAFVTPSITTFTGTVDY